ncbi:MAG: ECF transporter S component [Oscillospiraceae bacterium]|nr:ECF transporter S component [Oscillospiraceae bacterium]
MRNEKNSSKELLLKLCISGMFAALICVATMMIRIPLPLCGYVNFGDCFILVAAWILGPVYGFAAGGIGSAFADLFSGYAQYVPGTFVIKGLIAVAAALIARAFLCKSEKLRFSGYVVGGIVGEIVMVGGYYLYESTALGVGFAAAFDSVLGNTVQGAFGVALSVVLAQVIAKTKILKKFRAYAV